MHGSRHTCCFGLLLQEFRQSLLRCLWWAVHLPPYIHDYIVRSGATHCHLLGRTRRAITRNVDQHKAAHPVVRKYSFKRISMVLGHAPLIVVWRVSVADLHLGVAGGWILPG